VIPNLFGNVMAKLGNAILTFIATVILSRLLGAEGNGYFSLFIANAGLAILIIGFGIENAFTFFVAQKTMPVQKIFNTSIVLAILQSAIILILGYSFMQISANFQIHKFFLQYSTGELSNKHLVFIFIFLLSTFLQLYLISIFNGSQVFSPVNKAIKYIQVFIIISLLLFGKNIQTSTNGSDHLISFYLIAQCIAPIYLLYKYLTILQPNHQFNIFLEAIHFKQLLQFAGLALVINCIQFLAYRADIWILNNYALKSDVGIYGLSQKLIQMYWMVPMAISSITFPMLSQTGNLSGALLAKTVRIIMQVWFYLSVVSLFISPFLITLFFGKAFSASATPFLIILPGALLFIFAIMLAPYFSAKNLLTRNLLVSSICLVVIISLDYLLIPKQGIIGAAIASSIGYGVAGVVSLIQFCKLENIAIHSFFKRSKNIITDINTTILGR
jgi:O-antigen/teichoic acid export membrane protein